MSGWGWPNFELFIGETWGFPNEIAGPGFNAASGIVVGANPPYSVTDFLSIYPNFGGVPLILTGVITQGSAVITGLSTTAGVLPGQPVSPSIPIPNPITGQPELQAGPFPNGTTVASVDSASQITVSQPATVDGTQVAIYNSMWVPPVVIAMYVNLASASLVQARWGAAWQIGMSWFICHFCVLWLRSAGDPATSAGQLAGQGLARGIAVSKSAGGVSIGIQLATASGGLESWGAWQTTEAGVQFATMARIIGMGPMLIY
jgi:hypothetical protein